MVRRRMPGSDAIVLRRRTPWLTNGLGTIAVIRCTPGGHGTVVRVTLRSRAFIATYLALWMVGLLIANLIALYNGVIAAVPFTLIPLALLFATVALGRFLARDDGRALMHFIRQTTGVQDLAPELRPSF